MFFQVLVCSASDEINNWLLLLLHAQRNTKDCIFFQPWRKSALFCWLGRSLRLLLQAQRGQRRHQGVGWWQQNGLIWLDQTTLRCFGKEAKCAEAEKVLTQQNFKPEWIKQRCFEIKTQWVSRPLWQWAFNRVWDDFHGRKVWKRLPQLQLDHHWPQRIVPGTELKKCNEIQHEYIKKS